MDLLQRSVADDWVSFTSRSWVQGPVDAILGNPHLADMMLTHPELEQAVDGIIDTGNEVLMKVGLVFGYLMMVGVISTTCGCATKSVTASSLSKQQPVVVGGGDIFKRRILQPPYLLLLS